MSNPNKNSSSRKYLPRLELSTSRFLIRPYSQDVLFLIRELWPHAHLSLHLLYSIFRRKQLTSLTMTAIGSLILSQTRSARFTTFENSASIQNDVARNQSRRRLHRELNLFALTTRHDLETDAVVLLVVNLAPGTESDHIFATGSRNVL